MQRLKKKIFKNYRCTIWSFVVILTLFVSSLSWMYYCDLDFMAVLSALTLMPDFALNWFMYLDLHKVVKVMSSAGLIIILGLLFVHIVLKKKIGIDDLRIKPPRKYD